MNYSRIQKFIAGIIIPFFMFGMVFHFPINFFNISNAGNTKLYSLVSILVNENIYNDVKNSLETYSEDISKQLKNTKVIIIPTPNNATPFQIASLNEKLYYEGYKGVNKNSNFKSRLVGTILVGNFPIPTVYKGSKNSSTILPYVDFEDKSYIYDHKTNKYIANSENINGIKPEIWHGVISPNSGNKEIDIKKINDFFEKDHNFYEGKGNFEKNKEIINGKINEKNPDNYKPYVFYFDAIREQQSLKYNNYIGYQAYLRNKEDIIYKRYSKDLANKIKGEVLENPTKEIKGLISQINPKFEFTTGSNGPDISNTPDILTKPLIDKTSKKFIEVINTAKIGEFRKNVNNAGRYSGNGNKVNVDFIPYLVSALDSIEGDFIKGANDTLEEKINDLVINKGLSRKIAIPTYIHFNDKHGSGSTEADCDSEYENILFGKQARNIKQAKDCSVYLGTNSNSGQLVEANRGINIKNTSSDINTCNLAETSGYWGGNSPLNLDIQKTKSAKLELKSHDLNQAIRPIFDIKGSYKFNDNSKTPSPLDCLKNNFFVSYEQKSYFNKNSDSDICITTYSIPINGQKPSKSNGFFYLGAKIENWTCGTNNKKYNFNGSFKSIYNSGKKLYLNGKLIKGSSSTSYHFKTIPSYIKHISPTTEELNQEYTSKITPNLPIDKDRYIDFIGANGKYKKINYPYLFRIQKDLSGVNDFDAQLKIIGVKLDQYLDNKSKEINNIIKSSNPNSLTGVDLEIYKNYLKNGDFPSANVDLKKFLKDKKETSIKIGGEEKKLSYYDSLVFSIFWNNLSSIEQKYKFVFQNYLSDQTNSNFKHYLPKNKKIYEIAYLGAPGNAKNMFIDINPEEKGVNPYANIDKLNGLLFSEILASSIGKKDFGKNDKNSLFKCAPPEGVTIFKWPSAVMCRLKNLSIKVDFSSSRCSSKTLFSDEEKEEKTKKAKTCNNDLNKNGVDDCLEKDLKNAKIELSSSAQRVYTNSFISLEEKILNSEGKLLNGINNVKTEFKLIKIEDNSNKKIVAPDNYNKYINFIPSIIPNNSGKAKQYLYSKDKEANYYFKAITYTKDQNGKEILKKESNTIKIEVRENLLSSQIDTISNNEIFIGKNDILANDKTNIYLIDLNNGNLESKKEDINKNSNAKEKIIASLDHHSKGNKRIPLDYPLKLSLTKDGEKVIDDFNITKQNLAKFFPAYSLTKTGEYKLKITNKYGETTTQTFNIIPEKASKIETHLSTNILENSGDITSNIFVLKDKYGNISNGYNYKVILKSEGNFSFYLNSGENLSKKEISVYEGYKGFRIKPGKNPGAGKIKIDVLYNGKLIATDSRTIQTISKINISLIKPSSIKVGAKDIELKLDFKDNQGNLLKNLNSRVYFSMNSNYGIPQKPYFIVEGGKAIVKLKTKTLAGQNIPIELKMEGLREISKKSITIEPEKPIKLNFNISKKIAKASTDEKINLIVQLQDRYNNKVFTDNSTKLKFEIKDKYKNILKLNSPLIQTSKKGEVKFDFNATSTPGIAYFKVSTIPDLSTNYFEVERTNNGKIENKKIYGVGEKAGKIKTYYFWDKQTFKDRKYNSLYTVMLGADYGNIREKDYLASTILFDKNNRSLAVTSLLNNPYKFSDLVSISNNGKIESNSSQDNLTQDLELDPNINQNNNISVDIYNKILNRKIGNLDYNFTENTKLGICKTTIGECGIDENKNSIYLKDTNNSYKIIQKNNNLFLQKDGKKIIEINNKGKFISNSLLKFEIDTDSNEKFLIINIIKEGEIISKLIINISNKNIKINLFDSDYNVHNKIINGKITKNIYYNDIFSSQDERNNFSRNRIEDIENFKKEGGIGWKGENKFLLNFAAGKNVGEAVLDKESFGTINLGDPVISLKPIQNKFSDGTKKSFNSTIGKKITNEDNIKNYQIFDYDNDSKDDILLIKDDGFLKLLENKSNSKDFLNKGNLAYISDKGNPNFVRTGDFSGDGFDDIFFVNDKNIPFILNNHKKDFVRISLEKQFNLKGNIIQVETFDMDNDGKTDIITLDESGEINIFYGGGTSNSPKFTKKLVGNGLGLKLNSTPRDNGALISFDGLYQIPKQPNTSDGLVNQDFLNKQIFTELNIGTDKNTGKDIKKTFIKSEYSKSSGIEVQKIFKDKNGGNLKSGDIVEVEIKITNISNSIKRNISYLDKIQKPFILPNEEIDYSKLGFSNPLPGYDFYIKNINLAPGSSKIIKYNLKTPNLTYGYLRVGLFEKGEIGDDKYGDIIVQKDNKNCSDNTKIYRSITARTYTDLQEKGLTCDENKIKLPKEIEDAKNINVSELEKNPVKAAEYAQKELEKSDKEELKNLENKDLNGLDKINEWTEEKLKDLDNLLDGFSCGFGGAGCITTPLNWAPLAAGNDPTLFGRPIGDGLKVGEGIPVLSGFTGENIPTSFGCYQVPTIWPLSSNKYTGVCNGTPGAGGSLGINSPTNFVRMFISPTLTGGIGTAVCYGGPASVAGNSNPQGISPVLPGGNCIVVAKPLLSCKGDGSNGDPKSIGTPDYYGGDLGVINGNCKNNTKPNPGRYLNKNFVDRYVNGLGNPTTFTTPGFKKDYINALKGYKNNIVSPITTKPLFSLNGEGIGEQELHTSANFASSGDANFEDIIKIKKDRVSAFPSFLMDWSTKQIDEIVTKLTDFPTLFLILPDFSGIVDTDWSKLLDKTEEENKKYIEKENDDNKEINNKITQLENEKNNLECDGKDRIKCFSIDYKIKTLKAQKIGNFSMGQNSSIKTAYDFMSNIPLIELEPQQINVEIPFPDEHTLDKFLADGKATLQQWKAEANSGKFNAETNLKIQELISNLNTNLHTIEEYKQIPRKLAKLLNQKEVRINQILCNIDSISEMTNGRIGRNGKRFKAWVETYILIKAVLKSWQLLVDVFNDYDAECHECKNERQDLLQFEFKLVSFIIPKFPIIQFPKWPDLILDLHNIRAGITIKIPDVVITQRPLVLPNLPKLTLPTANVNLDIDIPNMPLLPKYKIPELPDIPTLPEIKLPDLPPPPKLPKIFSQLEGVLKILKLVTKAMCMLKQLPFVPEWRAGDQIAFLTERNGYMPTDFIDLSLPQFSVPYLDAIKVTTYVNMEQDTSFLVDTLRSVIEPFNNKINNIANKFSNAGLDNLDFSDKSININKEIDLKKDKKTSFSESVAKDIKKLYSYISKNKDEKINSKKFKYLINKSLASNIFVKDPRTDKIKKLWKQVNNYNFNKEDKLISELEKNNREKFENLNNILKNELRKNYQLKKDLKNFQNKNYRLFSQVSAKTKNKDFINYKKSVKKYNDKFIKSAQKLINGGEDKEVLEIKQEGKKLLTRVNGGLNSFSKGKQNIILPPLGTSPSRGTKAFNTKGRDKLLTATQTVKNIQTQNYCQKAQRSEYHYNYKGLYILEKDKNYRLFNYLDELNGNETYSPIDYDKDGDLDLVYFMNGNLYLKENLKIQKEKNIKSEQPIILKIADNKYFNGENFIEAVNGFKEINTTNGFLNIFFNSPTDKNINHFNIEYYTIVDKFLNEEKIDGIGKNIIDAFVKKPYKDYKKYKIEKNNAYINHVGDVPAVRLDTYKLANLSENIIKNNRVNISATTPIYTGKNSAKIEYYFSNNKDNILNTEIPKNSSIRFKENIVIQKINGNIYAKTDKKISLIGNEINNYIGLPLFEKSQLSIIPDLKNKLVPDLANIEISYDSGYSRMLNFTEINSYYYYNLGEISDNYLIKIPVNNDYYYSKIFAIKGKIRGTYSAQKLFSPQIYADKISPSIEGLSKIRIPVYQKYKLNLKKYIFENSGLSGIKNIDFIVKENSNIVPDNYKINKDLYNPNIEFEKFNKLFKEKVKILLEDKNGNKSITPIDFEVYSPIPQINKNIGNKIIGEINEKLIEEPINVYRIRSGVIKRLETTDNKIKTYTVDEGKFNFNAKGKNSNGLILKDNNQVIAEINENTGKINIKNNNFKINILNNNSLFPQINIEDTTGKSIYSQIIKLENNIEIKRVENFSQVKDKGLFIKLENQGYNLYNIPNGAKYSAGDAIIYKKSDTSKKQIFTIFTDGRIKYDNIKYYMEYKTSGNNIILELKSRIGNKKIAELLYNINGTYLMK